MAQETAQLLIQLDGQVFQTLPLTMPVLTIGRTPDNGLVLPHPTVSRRHAELRLEGNQVLLTDLHSTSGTFVAGIKILPDQPQQLADGAVFQIGPFVLAYRLAVTSAVEASSTQAVTKEDAEQQDATPMGTSVSTPEEPGLPAPVPVTVPEEPRLPPPVPVAVVPVVPSTPPRQRLPVPRAQGHQSRYLQYLPIIFQDNEFLGRYLQIFETIWEPLEQRQDHIAMYFDPRTCPVSFLPWIASWLGLSFSQHWPEMRVRHLLSEAMDLYRLRGTRYGLTRMIELCTGLTPTISDDPQRPYVIHISLTIPAGSDVELTLVEDLVRTHKPAHVGYVLEVQS